MLYKRTPVANAGQWWHFSAGMCLVVTVIMVLQGWGHMFCVPAV